MTIFKSTRLAVALALAAGTFAMQAQAAPVVSVVPGSQNLGVGATTTVDIVVSGLTQSLGGFSFVLGFSNGLIAGGPYSANPDNKMGLLPLDLSGGFMGGALDIFYLAGLTATEAGLAADQGASFTLATMTFTGLAAGLSPLTLSTVNLSNFTGGATVQGVGISNGSVCVGGNCNTVPEPTTALLVATALGALVLRRGRKAT